MARAQVDHMALARRWRGLRDVGQRPWTSIHRDGANGLGAHDGKASGGGRAVSLADEASN